jgi:hypothetical protein
MVTSRFRTALALTLPLVSWLSSLLMCAPLLLAAPVATRPVPLLGEAIAAPSAAAGVRSRARAVPATATAESHVTPRRSTSASSPTPNHPTIAHARWTISAD